MCFSRLNQFRKLLDATDPVMLSVFPTLYFLISFPDFKLLLCDLEDLEVVSVVQYQ